MKFKTIEEYNKDRMHRLVNSPGEVSALMREHEKNPKRFLELAKEHRDARIEIVKEEIEKNKTADSKQALPESDVEI